MSDTTIMMGPHERFGICFRGLSQQNLLTDWIGKEVSRETKDNSKICGMNNQEDTVIQGKVGLRKEIKTLLQSCQAWSGLSVRRPCRNVKETVGNTHL